MDAQEQQVVADLKEIVRLAGDVARAGGPDDALGVRNRATEIAALAETVVWLVDPRAADWALELYGSARGMRQDGGADARVDAQAPPSAGPPPQA